MMQIKSEKKDLRKIYEDSFDDKNHKVLKICTLSIFDFSQMFWCQQTYKKNKTHNEKAEHNCPLDEIKRHLWRNNPLPLLENSGFALSVASVGSGKDALFSDNGANTAPKHAQEAPPGTAPVRTETVDVGTFRRCVLRGRPIIAVRTSIKEVGSTTVAC